MNIKYDLQYRQLGLKIAYYRKLRGLTQEQLAEKIEKSAAFIGHVEAPNVDKAISLDTLFDISTALDVPAYKFFVFDDWFFPSLLYTKPHRTFLSDAV